MIERQMKALCACLLLLACACGPAGTGNSVYAGSWPSFVVNGSQNLGGFIVDSNGQFQLQLPGLQVNGTLGSDASLSGVVQGAGAGLCTLQGRCTSKEVCNGTATGSGCPTDSAGRQWATIALCRGPGC